MVYNVSKFVEAHHQIMNCDKPSLESTYLYTTLSLQNLLMWYNNLEVPSWASGGTSMVELGSQMEKG